MTKKTIFLHYKKWLKPFFIINTIFLLSIVHVQAQTNSVNWNQEKDEFTLQVTNETIKNVLGLIEKNSRYIFAYSEGVNGNLNKTISLSVTNGKINTVLDKLFATTGMTYKVSGRQVTISPPKPVATEEPASGGSVRVTGNVTDANGEPLIGLAVTVKNNTGIGVVTDIDGNYTLTVPSNRSVLVFNYVGYEKREESVGSRRVINVTLQEDAKQMEEVVVVAYGSQKKESVVGSITTVAPDQLKVGTSRSLSNNLAGTVAGVIGVQRSGEPGYDDSNFWIRGISSFQGSGTPLVLIDGIERSLNNIDTEEIESFSVLKDAAASAVYGVRGANGVILINTKRGKIGKPTIVVKGEFAATKPVKLPEYIGAADYLEILDEIRLDNGLSPMYTERIEKTRNGYDPDLYPDVNWIDAVTKDNAANQRITMEVSGGSERLRYSFVAAFYNERGIIETDPNQEWDSTLKLQRYNVRSNVDVNLSPTTLMRFNIGGYLQDKNAPRTGISDVFQKAFVSTPHQFPTQYSTGQIARIGDEYNPWEMATQRGFVRSNASQIETLFSLEQDLKFLTPGLKVKGTFSFDRYSSGSVTRGRNSAYYSPATGRTEEGDLIITQTATGTNFLNYLKGGDYGNRATYMEANLTYNRLFDELHAVEGLLLFNRRNYDDGDKWPYRNQGMAARASYTFGGRYVAEFNCGYNGSENFASGKRYGFFPSGAIGWIVSEESFMEATRDILSKLKFRGSYGQVGNAQLSGRRFAYLSTIQNNDDNGAINGYTFGTNMKGYSGLAEGDFGVPDLTWEIVNKLNVGVEIGLFKAVDLQIDFFDERRTGIFMERTSVPDIAGFYKKPWSNYGKVHNKGFDLSLNFNKQITKDFFLGFFGTFTYAHNKIIEQDEAYAVIGTNRARTGYPVGQIFGLEAIGLFTEDDFDSSGNLITGIPDHTFATVRPGDIRYKDISGPDGTPDGKIDVYDEKAIGGTVDPEIVYGFGINGRYKNIDFGILFQGNGRTYRMLGRGVGSWIPGSGNGATGNIFTNVTDRWTVDNPSQDVFWPRLSYGSNNNNTQSSTWWLQNMSLLRVKDIEVGYTFPRRWTEKAMISTARIFVRGSNMLTFSKFKLWDPELNNNNNNYGNFGAQYPIMKSISAGFDIRF